MTSSRDSTISIGITGMGMVSSLGQDLVTGCAAARAGLIRSSELDYFQVRSPEGGEIESAIGHPIPLLTSGFEGDTRLLRLARAGLADLQRFEPHMPLAEIPTGFYLSLPDPRRLYTGLNLIANEQDRQALAEEAKEAEKEVPDESRTQRLLQKAAQLSGWPGEPSLRFVAISGHTGVAEALREAVSDLSAGLVEAAIVGGMDSLLEEETLGWLQNTSRLMTPGVATGLQPGEASAFLLLEPVQNARARRGSILACVQDVRMGEESKPLLSGEPPTGGGLEEVLAGVMESAAWKDTPPVWLITDQNGEPYRAMEWGNAIVRLLSLTQVFVEPILWYPAASFGDTGAASGAVSLCIAASAFARGYAPAGTVIVLSSADASLRSSILLTRSNTGGKSDGRSF